jgi:hypothetical protein
MIIMADPSPDTSPAPQTPYPAEKARGGEIILRHRWQRVVFILGLAVPIALLLLLVILR